MNKKYLGFLSMAISTLSIGSAYAADVCTVDIKISMYKPVYNIYSSCTNTNDEINLSVGYEVGDNYEKNDRKFINHITKELIGKGYDLKTDAEHNSGSRRMIFVKP